MTTGADAAELQIDLAAAAANWRLLARMAADGGGAAGAVIKADAYGLGAKRIAPALLAAGCEHFFTAHLSEAIAVRPVLPGVMIAALNGLWPGAELEYLRHDIRPVLGSLGEIEAWSAMARRLEQRLPALLHVDTGMNRLGLPPDEVDALVEQPGRLEGIAVQYVMTHLISAEAADDPANEAQRLRFECARARLPAALGSLANASGLFLGQRFASDLARPGAALYGVNPTPGRANPMQPVVRLRAPVLQARTLAAGETVGYNGRWTAARTTRIATVAVGYADGYMRSLGNRATAFFDGAPVPLVGRVSMDLTTFDITDAPGADKGGWLELIGPETPIDALAEQAGTTGYEMLTSLGRRYARAYLPA